MNIKLKDLTISEIKEYISNDNYYFVQNGKKVRLFSKGTFICKYRPRSRRYGTPLLSEDMEEIVVKKKQQDIEAQWFKGWTKVLKEMKTWNVWPELQNEIETGLELGLSVTRELNKYWSDSIFSEKDPETEKKEMLEITGGKEVTSFVYWRMSEPPVTKKMRFHDNVRYHKSHTVELLKNIKDAFENNTPYRCVGRNGYDCSFEFSSSKEGINRAWYSEEYRGMGNGHYYIAYSPTHALFIETD